MASAGKNIQSLGKALTVGVSVPLATVSGLAFKFGADYNEALIGVAKTTDLTGAELDKFSDEIMQMTRRLPASAVEIANVAENAGQLGIETKNLSSFTESMIKLGHSTNLSADEASMALAKLANITGMPQTEFDRLGSVVVELGNNLATTERDVVNMGLRLATAGTQVGLTEAQILALSGAISSVGIEAEAGGSAMSRVLQKINTEVLSSGDNLQGFADVAGMTAQEFSDTWKGAPQEAIVAFVAGLGRIKESGGDVSGTLQELGIRSVHELNTLGALAGNTDLLTDSLNMANDAWQENTALNKEAQAAFESTKSKIQMMINALQEFGLQITGALEPIVGKFIDVLTSGIQKATDYLKGLSDEQVVQIAKWGAMTAAIGPFLTVIGSALSGIGTVTQAAGGAVNQLTSTVGKLGAGFTQMKTFALNALTTLGGFSVIGPLFQKIDLGVTNAGVKMLDFGESISQSENKFIRFGGQAAQTSTKVIGQLNALSMAGLKMAVPATMIGALVAAVGAAGIAFADEIEKMVNLAITKGPEIITKLGEGITTAIPTLIETGTQVITGFGMAIAANLPAIFEQGTNIIVSLIEGLGDNLPQLIQIGFQVIGQFLIGIASNLPRIALAGVNFIVQLVQGIVQNLPMLISMAGQAIAQFVQGMVANLPQILMMGIQLVAELIKGIVTGIPSIVSAGWDIIKGLAQGILDGVVNFIPNVVEGIKGIFSNLWSWLKGDSEATSQKLSSDMQTASFEMNSSAYEMNANISSQFGSMFGTVTGYSGQMSSGVSDDMARINENGQLEIGDFTNQTEGQMSAWANNVGAEAQRAQSSVNASTETLKNTSVADFSTLQSSVSSSSSSATNSVISNFNQMSTGSTNEVSQMAGMTEQEFQQMTSQVDNQMLRLEGVFKRAFGAINVQVKESISQISDTYNQGMTEMLAQSNRTVSSVTNVFRNFASTMRSLGAQAGSGFANGLAGQRGRIMAQANSIASSVASTIRRALSIHSPSRVLKYLGEMTGAGFADGIEHMIPTVESSSDKMARSAIPHIEDNLASANQVDQHITHHLAGMATDSKQETFIIKLNVGGYDFREFVQSINREQGKVVELGGTL